MGKLLLIVAFFVKKIMKSQNFSLHLNVFTLFISYFVSKIWQFKTGKVNHSNLSPKYMSKTAKNILSLNHEEVMDFFMKSEQYHGFELPEFFTFDEVLKFVRKTIGDAPYEECIQEGITPDKHILQTLSKNFAFLLLSSFVTSFSLFLGLSLYISICTS